RCGGALRAACGSGRRYDPSRPCGYRSRSGCRTGSRPREPRRRADPSSPEVSERKTISNAREKPLRGRRLRVACPKASPLREQEDKPRGTQCSGKGIEECPNTPPHDDLLISPSQRYVNRTISLYRKENFPRGFTGHA